MAKSMSLKAPCAINGFNLESRVRAPLTDSTLIHESDTTLSCLVTSQARGQWMIICECIQLNKTVKVTCNMLFSLCSASLFEIDTLQGVYRNCEVTEYCTCNNIHK